MAVERPATDVVVERDIMIWFVCAFWRAWTAGWAIGCAAA
jgi:hypothetical protein